jgi:proteasome lid subunit RPN8/RPN11
MLANARKFLSGFQKANITNSQPKTKKDPVMKLFHTHPSHNLRISHNQRQQSHAAVEAIAHLSIMLANVINET